VAIAGASALSWVNPAYSGPGFVIPVAIGSVVLLTGVNAMGARASGGMSILTVAIKLVPLVGVGLILALQGRVGKPFQPLAPAPFNLANLGSAVALTFFALTGFENATTPVGKVRDPERTIPRAILWGTLFVAIIYLVASTSVQLLLPAKLVAASPAPFADAISLQWGARLASVAALAIAVAAFGSLNGMILATGELGYAMGLRRDLPAFMTWTLDRGTPVGSQLVAAVLSVLLILANSSRASEKLFSFIILLSTAAVLVVYLAGVLSAWRLSKSAGSRAAMVVASLFILFATYGSGLEADLWCLVLLVIGIAVRWAMHRVSRPEPDPALAPS
jgi:APA family basic amino acid/polyamine antiporter